MSTPLWVIVYAGTAADTAMLYSLLEAEEIPVRIGDEVMGTMAPYMIDGGQIAAVKVMVPEDRVDDAQEVVSEFVEGSKVRSGPASLVLQRWECPCCHEHNDGTFDICWNCQTEKSWGQAGGPRRAAVPRVIRP
jgi:hypothetical protein